MKTQSETMKYKVFFHQGEDLGIKTHVNKGTAWVDGTGLHVEGPETITLLAKDITGVELFRLHGLGRVVKIDHRMGRLYLSVVRLMIGQFAFINFFKTGYLHQELSVLASSKQN